MLVIGKEFYPDAEEELPDDMPTPFGKAAQITISIDTDHAHDSDPTLSFCNLDFCQQHSHPMALKVTEDHQNVNLWSRVGCSKDCG